MLLMLIMLTKVIKFNLETPSIVDAHRLDIIVGEVALCCFSRLPVQHKQVEAPHDPPYLVVMTTMMLQAFLFGEIGSFENPNLIDPNLQW